jgi:hypothetical protein
LFQVKLSFYGGTFYIATSVTNFQLLEMLKFNRKGNDEGKCWLDCSSIDPFLIRIREVMVRLTIKTKVCEGMMKLISSWDVMKFNKYWCCRMKFKKRFLFTARIEVGKMVGHGEIEGVLSNSFRMKNLRLPLESGRSFHDENMGNIEVWIVLLDHHLSFYYPSITAVCF